MASRAFEHVVLFTVATSVREEETDEGQIVLLAWLILSTSKNQVITKEQQLVCPSQGAPAQRDLPVGIRADAVQSAGTMALALKQFHATLSKIGGSFCLLTAGHFPLRNLLHPELHRNGIPLQQYLCRYFDIFTEFSRAFPSVTASTIEDVCDSLGVSAGIKEQRYGLAELKVLCEVTQKLISQGHVFQRPEVIHESCDYTAAVNPSKVQEGCVVRLRGLPFQASLKEVAGFLVGLNCIPGGLVFGINAVGRRTGEALVALESPEQAELARKRHKHYLDQRYIEVYSASRDDFLRFAGSGGSGGASDNVGIIRMQGLPYRASEEDIVDFFGSEASVKDGEDGVLIVKFSDGRASGDAFAVFDSDVDLEKALEKDKTSMGSRYVELFRSSVKEFELVLNRSGSQEQQRRFVDMLGLSMEQDSEGDGLRGRERNCVKLRGLPWSATPEDVIRFFGELKDDISTHGVHMVLNAMNRPTGDCYVQLKTVDGASKACEQLHKQYIGNRYIEVFQCSGDEVAHALLDSGGGRGYSGGGGYRGGGGGGGGGRRRRGSGGAVVKARGLPFSTTEYELAGFFEEYDVGERDVEIVYNQSGRSVGIAYVTFPSRSQALQAIREKDGKHIGHRYVELSMS